MVGYEGPDQLGQTEIFLAGGAAGFFSRFISQPLDVLKVKFQLQVEPISQTSETSKYRSLVHAVRVLWREEGARAFWSGHNAGQLLSIIYGAVNVEGGVAVDFVCGVGAGCSATFVSYPFDVLRTRFIAQGTKNVTNHTYRSMINGLVKMVRHEGVLVPYRGLLPALIQNAPLIGISFATHSLIKSYLYKSDAFSDANSRLNLSGNMIAGAVAGFVSKTTIYPLDLVRRRIQFQGFQDARIGYGKNFTCWGFVDCVRNILREEGPRGLFKGYVPSAVKTSISTSLYFTIFEELCDVIKIVKRVDAPNP